MMINSKWLSNIANPFDQTGIGLSATVASNALTLALKRNDGSSNPSALSPVKVAFRSSVITTGGFTVRNITSSISLVVPSSATLGTQNAIASFLYLYLIDNAGTVELAISGMLFDTEALQSTTAISSSATSSKVLYSTTARSNVPIRLFARLRSTQSTAGTWASAMSEVSVKICSAETVYESRTTTAGQVVPANGVAAAVDFGTLLQSSHGGYTAGSGYNSTTGAWTTEPKWTPPSAGLYIALSSLVLNAGSNTTQFTFREYMYKNGVNAFEHSNSKQAATGGYSIPNFVMGMFKLSTSDYLQIVTNCDYVSGGFSILANANRNYWHIVKMGDYA